MLKSDRILSEIKRISLEEKIVDVDEEQAKLVVFVLEDNLWAIFGREVSEILPSNGITWIPGATEFVPGVINVRGDIQAVIDVGRVLGITLMRKSPGYFMITRKANSCNAILVDSIFDVVDVPISVIKSPLITLDVRLSQVVINQLELNGKIVKILDVDRIVDQVTI